MLIVRSVGNPRVDRFISPFGISVGRSYFNGKSQSVDTVRLPLSAWWQDQTPPPKEYSVDGVCARPKNSEDETVHNTQSQMEFIAGPVVKKEARLHEDADDRAAGGKQAQQE
jgi:hypothetical protein